MNKNSQFMSEGEVIMIELIICVTPISLVLNVLLFFIMKDERNVRIFYQNIVMKDGNKACCYAKDVLKKTE